MKNTIVTDGIYRLSATIHDILFEGIWPLPYGVSMNSYIVKGKETAIIDGFCGWEGVPEVLFEQLAQMHIDIQDIHYVILNHLEPDHSGWLANFKRLTNDFEIVATPKAIELAKAFYGFDEKEYHFRAVTSGSTLVLGDGKALQFEEIPNVHWPETMATYETSTGTLFSCDAFGSFGSVSEDAPFDDLLDEKTLAFFEEETIRYYANIVSTFSVPVQRAIQKLSPLTIHIIAPGHGIIWRKYPIRIITLYQELARWSQGQGITEPEITLLWGSMYGMTERALEPAIAAVTEANVPLHIHRVPETHVSFILSDVIRSRGIILAMPTYEYKMFPPMAHVLDDIGRKKIQHRKAFYLGSFGWSGGALKELQEINERYQMEWDFLEPVTFRGEATAHDRDMIYQQVTQLAKDIKSNN